MTVLLLHYIHNDQEETWCIAYGASLMLTTPTSSTMVWNRCPYWGSFLSMNNSWTGCMSALGLLKELGHFVPVWSWLFVDTPFIQAFWSLEVSTPHILRSSECLGSKVVHLLRQNKSPSQKTPQSPLHMLSLCTCVVLGLEREEQRETERVLCVQSLHSQSQNNFRWRRDRERQISYDIIYSWNLKNTSELFYKTEIDLLT